MSECKRLAAVNLLLMVILWPASASARTVCFGETPPGDLLRHLLVSTTLILSVQSVFYVAAHLSWIIKRRVWPPADGSHTASSLYLVGAMAALTSVLLGIWGTFIGPAYRPMLFGESSWTAWEELPLVVQLLFGTGHCFWLATAAVVALWLATKRSGKRARYFEIALVVEIGVLYAILWAIYRYTIVLACPVSSA